MYTIFLWFVYFLSRLHVTCLVLFFYPCIPISNSVHFTVLALIYGGLMGWGNFFSVDVNLEVYNLVRRLWGALGVYILFYFVVLMKLVVGM